MLLTHRRQAQAVPARQIGRPHDAARPASLGRALRLALFVLIAGGALIAVGGGWPARATAQAAVTISMQGNRFLPDELTVPAGTTVIWANNDFASGEQHDVAANDGTLLSSVLNPGELYMVTLSSPGEYRYYCDLHDGMFGVIFVN